MTFTYPLGLLGLLSLPVILVLHLLRERRRRYVVSNLNLWSFLEAEVRGSRPRRIPFTWLLFFDLLIGTLLSLAWAQPRVPISLQVRDARHVIILLDVSTSMRARDVLPSRFSRAKIEATALLNNLGPRDVATILAFGQRPRWIADTREDEFQDLLVQITNLQAGETGHAFVEALALGLAALDGQLPAEFHILTDGAFPAPQSLAAGGQDKFAHPLQWHLFGGTVDNQAVLDVAITPLGGNQFQVFARLGNFGGQTASRVVALLADGAPVDSTSLQIPADSVVSQVWSLTGNPSVLNVSLVGGDILREDDNAAIGLRPTGKVRVALVAEDPGLLQQAIEAIPEAELRIIAPQDYTPLTPYEIIIFRDTLPEVWPDGDILIVDPPILPSGSEIGFLALEGNRPYSDIPANAPLQIPVSDPLLQGVDFNGVRWVKAWTLTEIPTGFVPLMQAGNVPLILRGVGNNQVGSTRIIVLLADLSSGNFTKHPAFPILMGNLIRGQRQTPLPDKLHTGEGLELPSPEEFRTLRIFPPGNSEVEFRTEWSETWEQTLEPGTYTIELENMAGKTFTYAVGVNAGDANESDLRPRTWMQDISGGPQSSMDQSGVQEPRQINLMPWLLSAAALVLLVEAMLAWR